MRPKYPMLKLIQQKHMVKKLRLNPGSLRRSASVPVLLRALASWYAYTLWSLNVAWYLRNRVAYIETTEKPLNTGNLVKFEDWYA